MSVSKKQKQEVRERANNCCEYCRVSQDSRLIRFQVDHIIATKHGGDDTNANLCLACYECNGYKGSNVAALDPQTGNATKLYHPRQQQWNDHFSINNDATIEGLTPEGRTTIAVLRINESQSVAQRLGEMELEEYPCES